jgi:hypothetical protein
MDLLLNAFEVIDITIVGMILVTVGCWSVFHAIRLTFWWPKTSARIVRYWIKRENNQPNKQRFFHPVIAFKTADGRVILAISPWGSWRKPWPAGSVVSVCYNQTNPHWAEIRCFANVWGMPLTFLGLTAFIVLLSWYLKCIGCP